MPDRDRSNVGDQWSRWLLGVREGGDRQVRARVLRQLQPVRDQVLERAAIKPGDVVLDVGTGDGLIAFGALDKVSPEGKVIFCDVSQALLEHAQGAAQALGVSDRCSFVECSADNLLEIGDSTVDVVTTRSVLIYVDNKATALAEFFRILKPGGRISLWEPINRLAFPEPRGRWFWYDVAAVEDLADQLKNLALGWQRDHRAMMDFDDRDLFALAEAAGFLPLHLELHHDVVIEHAPQSWESFAASSPNPLAPTVGEMLQRALNPEDRVRFIEHLRPQVEAGRRLCRMAVAHLWGERPPLVS